MQPLQRAAALGLAIVFTRHERKGGGEVGESGRGSSATAGAVDLIVSLRRPDGNLPKTLRKIETLGRFKETSEELIIEKTGEGYVSRGTESAVEKAGARGRILQAVPALGGRSRAHGRAAQGGECQALHRLQGAG